MSLWRWFLGLFRRDDGPPMFARSPLWAKVRAEHLERNPFCEGCGTNKDLEVHHISPVHLWPDRELQPGNLQTMCRRCHLLIGHLDSWMSWNPNVRDDCYTWRCRIEARPIGRDPATGYTVSPPSKETEPGRNGTPHRPSRGNSGRPG